MHVKTPAYIPWSQYDEIMKSMPDIDYLAQAGDIFQSAKVKSKTDFKMANKKLRLHENDIFKFRARLTSVA